MLDYIYFFIYGYDYSYWEIVVLYDYMILVLYM